MRKIFFCLSIFLLANCGGSQNGGLNTDSSTAESSSGNSPDTSNQSPSTETQGSSASQTETICNHEGICIPKSRASKNPNTDAFGFRKKVFSMPYEDKKE